MRRPVAHQIPDNIRDEIRNVVPGSDLYSILKSEAAAQALKQGPMHEAPPLGMSSPMPVLLMKLNASGVGKPVAQTPKAWNSKPPFESGKMTKVNEHTGC